jgi:hypothetical protein
MKKGIIISLVIFIALGIIAYGFYQFMFPQMVAKAIVSDDSPPYIPKRILNRIDDFRVPINKSSEDIVREIHHAGIPMKKILTAIDETSEEEAYTLLDELNRTPIKNTDQVFDIIKKHFDPGFDAEVFRKPFIENVDMKMVQKGMKYANMNRKTKDVDVETARAIIKQVLIRKEKELELKTDGRQQSVVKP